MQTNTTITTLVSPTGRKIALHHQDGTEVTVKCLIGANDSIAKVTRMEETTGEAYAAGKEAIGWTVTRRVRALVSY